MNAEIIKTADGSTTLHLPALNEHYHSVNGALTESEHIFLRNGYKSHYSSNPVVFELGFGTGLNALLTALEAGKQQRKTTYYCIEKYPLNEDILEQLNYNKLLDATASDIFNRIHNAPWNKPATITHYFDLVKYRADMIDFNFLPSHSFDIIYFDAFGPDKQPELWSVDIFKKIFNQCTNGAILVTYSAKGTVRRNLQQVGFTMERLPGPPGKRQMLRGTINAL